MQEDGRSEASRVTSADRAMPGSEPSRDAGHTVVERICRAVFGALAVGICLQALAAAIALAVVAAMIVLGFTGGSGRWALVVAGVVVVSVCAAVTACRLRTRSQDDGPEAPGS